MRATLVTGASTGLVVLAGIIRTKVIAVCVGPSGMGLFGILNSAIGLASTVFGMGTNKSGVRQIAAAVSSRDTSQISRTAEVLRWTSLAAGVGGALMVALFSGPIARLTTGSTQYSRYLVILAPTVFFGALNGAQLALLRGLGRVADLAVLNVLGALAGTLAASLLVWRWGLEGIAPAIVVTAGASLFASWLFARRLRIPTVGLSLRELHLELDGLFGLGLAFLLTAVAASALPLALRAILLQSSDLFTVGQFVAAMALSHVYSDFVLQAMGLDYLPRLTRARGDDSSCNRLMNEQAEIALLVGGPGIVGLVVFAPVLIPLFYSSRFTEAVGVFQWQCLGVILQLASWPIGTIFLARGLRTQFVTTMMLLNLTYLGSFYGLVLYFGLTGAAMSFAVAHAFYLLLAIGLARRITGFRLSSRSRRVLLVTGAAFAASLATRQLTQGLLAAALGGTLALAFALWAYRELCNRLGVSLACLVAGRVAEMASAALPRRRT